MCPVVFVMVIVKRSLGVVALRKSTSLMERMLTGEATVETLIPPWLRAVDGGKKKIAQNAAAAMPVRARE
jgi:hypothetical protein